MKHKLQDGELRLIKIDSAAVYEFLRETILEKSPELFDLHDMTKAEFHFSWDSDDTFCCIVSKKGLYKEADFEAIGTSSGLTTDSLFSKRRYRSIFIKTQEQNEQH